MPYKINGKPVAILPSFAPLEISAGRDVTTKDDKKTPQVENAYYLAHHMLHHGVDFVSSSAFDVIAIGDGVIKAAGIEPKIKGKDGLWGVVALVLDPFYHPVTGNTVSGVARYFHMNKVYVVPGQRVKQGDVIGRCITAYDDPENEYPGGHHLHFECGSSSAYSLSNPHRSPQVANGKYVKKGKEATIGPKTWLYIAPGQSVKICASATMASDSDLFTRRIINA